MTSRYHDVPVATTTLPDGTVARYRARRFIATTHDRPGDAGTATSRVDLLAAELLGAPEAWWRLLDANRALTADELEHDPGRSLIVPNQAVTP